MTKVVFVKGISSNPQEYQQREGKLYKFIENYLKEKKFDYNFLEHNDAGVDLSKIDYALAHSRGTNTLLDKINKQNPESIKAILVFDPSEQYKNLWNTLKTRKFSFISMCAGRPYSIGFANSKTLKDSHNFLNSLEEIKKKLDELLV